MGGLEVMKLWQAAEYLGVSHAKITTLVHSGALKFGYSELDHRVKLVKKSDMHELKRKSLPPRPPSTSESKGSLESATESMTRHSDGPRV